METIDSLYTGVVNKLTQQNKIISISEKLLSLTTNDERVLYVYELIEKLNTFPKLKTVKKCENLSSYYRNLGNQCFKKLENYQAWQYYNLSLLYALKGSDNYIIAISNRSAVLALLKKYKECLNDLEWIFSVKYPEKLKDKLLKRQKMCEEIISKEKTCEAELKEIDSIINYTGPRHPRYLCASPKVEVVFNDKMGRHVVAKEDISVGEIIACDDPYFILLRKSQFLFSCHYCLSRTANLFPCDKCCFTLYCSNECMEAAWKSYHIVECPITATLISMDFTHLEWLGLRTAIKARTDHDDWESLFNTINEAEATKNTELQGHINVGGTWVYDSGGYTAIHCLASNIEKRSISDIFQKSITAAVLLHLVKENTDFIKTERKSVEQCMAGLLLLHNMTSPTNMHNISSNTQAANGDYVVELNIASAPYAFLSLINHSCAPNVVRYNNLGNGQNNLFALRPIKKGMQIFDNYGSHHALEPRVARQQSLKFQYKFNCLCEACLNNWPVYFKLKYACGIDRKYRLEKENLLDSEAMVKLSKGDKETAYKVFKPLCKLAELFEPYAPCVELADCQEALKQCLSIFEGLVPYDYSQEVPWGAEPPKM